MKKAPARGKILFSVVSPVYRAETIVDRLVHEIRNELQKITKNFEIILVDDGSPDDSWAKIQRQSRQDKRIKGIKLSRNFGQHYAITAGIDHAVGKWIIVMDCDLQDLPAEIHALYAKAQEGYDAVLARRTERQDNILKRLFSFSYYGILSYLTGTKHDPAIGNFGIYNSKMIDVMKKMRESIRYFPVMIKWIGFKQTAINVQHGKRVEGKSNYNLKRLFALGMDIILAYSDKPIRLTIKIGMFIALSAFAFAVITVVRFLSGDIVVSGYTSLMASLWFIVGILMTTFGVVGLYIGKTFEGVKQRPIYIISEYSYEKPP